MITRFSEVLRPEAVLLDPENGTDREGLLTALGQRLRHDERVRSLDLFLSDVRHRERAGGTSLEHGLWMPHARSEEVTGLVMAAARIAPGQGSDGMQAVFLVGVPPSLAHDYLRLVGCLVRLWKDDMARKSLLESNTQKEWIERLDSITRKT